MPGPARPLHVLLDTVTTPGRGRNRRGQEDMPWRLSRVGPGAERRTRCQTARRQPLPLLGQSIAIAPLIQAECDRLWTWLSRERPCGPHGFCHRRHGLPLGCRHRSQRPRHRLWPGATMRRGTGYHPHARPPSAMLSVPWARHAHSGASSHRDYNGCPQRLPGHRRGPSRGGRAACRHPPREMPLPLPTRRERRPWPEAKASQQSSPSQIHEMPLGQQQLAKRGRGDVN